MMDEFITRVINAIFPHQQDIKTDEKSFWDSHWIKMNEYFKKNGEIFEIKDGWDFHCNQAFHQHYQSIVKNFNGLLCLECGCGGGYESALMARDGAVTTVLDYSANSLEYAKIVSDRLKISNKMEFVCENIFNYCPEKKYNLAWSCGVIEHYSDEDIVLMIKKMSSLVKNDNLVAITIPNMLSPQSIYWMLTEGKGSERFISHKKLSQLMVLAGLKNVQIKTLSYWLPSCFPYQWSMKVSKIAFINKLKFLSWLFTAVGIK